MTKRKRHLLDKHPDLLNDTFIGIETMMDCASVLETHLKNSKRVEKVSPTRIWEIK